MGLSSLYKVTRLVRTTLVSVMHSFYFTSIGTACYQSWFDLHFRSLWHRIVFRHFIMTCFHFLALRQRPDLDARSQSKQLWSILSLHSDKQYCPNLSYYQNSSKPFVTLEPLLSSFSLILLLFIFPFIFPFRMVCEHAQMVSLIGNVAHDLKVILTSILSLSLYTSARQLFD